MELLTFCPLCKNTIFPEFMKSYDYFLTKEEFTIVQCSQCTFKFVNPRPTEKEISRYYESADYVSHDTQNRSIRNYIYSMVRNYTCRNKRTLIEKYSSGRKLLDIGCGTGDFITLCKKSGWDVLGVEPNQKPREFAIRNHQVDVIDEPGLAIITEPSFDVITLWHVLEHVYRLEERMVKIKQILKKNGTLVIAVPNSNSWDAKHYKKFWAAYDLPRHIYHFSSNTMLLLANNFGFSIEEIVPMKFDAFYISLLSQKYSKGNSNYFEAIFNGFRSNFNAWKNKKEYSSLIFVLKAK
jgi:2-polyprenyl-3-methyl-5-hydroxy-6-metoxy-1,4-benzoquinol methylase